MYMSVQKDWARDYDLFDADYVENPFSVWESLRGECPVAHTDRYGGSAKLTTKRASAVVTVAVDDSLRPGHISLPNGFGLDHLEGSGERVSTGVGTNEFTAMHDRDPWAGTPWHKTTPARLERV